MNYIQGTHRDQLVMFNEYLDNIIEEDNPVRVIDAYVEALDIEKLGFKKPELRTGKPPYRLQLFLKIYIYGYNDRTRSSRRLERECNRNNEMIWLTEGLKPDFKTISDFRKNNRKGLNNIFKEFLKFCHKMGLLSLETVAIDGTKMRAQNSLNEIYNRDEIDKIQKKIQKKIDEYLSLLDEEDKKEAEDLKLNEDKVEEVIKKLKRMKKYGDKVENIKKIFEKDKKMKRYFATDKDSRFQSDKGKVRAGYNPQIATENKNKLILANDVTNESNDQKQMTPMIKKVKETKEELEINTKTEVVMDAGYFSESEVMNNKDDEKNEIVVPDKKEASKKKKKAGVVPADGFEADDFQYNSEEDVFICPDGKILKKTHTKPCIEKSGREVFEYQCYSCNGCKQRYLCTKNKRGRAIKISANKELIDKFKELMKTEEKKKIINKRKELVEHPFGTLKRNLGYTYFMQKGLEKVRAEFSLICFTYNFKRVINILGTNKLLKEITMLKEC